MGKKLSGLNHTMFDVAVVPSILILLGVPLLIVIFVIALVVVTIKLIRKAHASNQAEKNNDLK